MHDSEYQDPDDATGEAGDPTPDWADLKSLGVPNVEQYDDSEPTRHGGRTAVALVLAAAVVAGGIAVVAPTVSKALGGSDRKHPASASPTTLSAEQVDAQSKKPSATPKPEPKPTPSPSSTTQAAPVGQDVSRLADATWIRRVSQQANIPERALASYAGASLRVKQLRPQCNLGWNTLAAIGNVESHHGSINHNNLGADGQVRPGVYGIALNGGDKVAAIPDTDHGRLDGDKQWDRAVGPMQFIPSTWESIKQDGSGDGIVDVQQLDDAALSAGVYLCDAGGDLNQPKNWIKAIASYNPSLQYNNDIARIATTYAGIN